METPHEIFEHTGRLLAAEPHRTEGLTATYQFDIDGEGGGSWTLAVVEGAARVSPGPADQPDVVVLMEAQDFVDLSNGRLNGQDAFLEGRMRVLGQAGLGMRLATILG